MGAKLHIQPESAPPFEVAINNTATIGRTRENTVCLGFSPLVSRQHALIRCYSGNHYQIIDMGSRNGTYVNDHRVVMPVPLQDGARIRIAENTITFREQADGMSDETAQVTMIGAANSTITQERSVALLVCDIRGFSTMSEKTSTGELAELLGVWFREAGNIVARVGGTVDKFIGDAMLAYWSTSTNGKANSGAAFYAARQMQSIAAERKWPNGDPFRIAIALHYGRVTCSNVGVAAERDATIVGDAVNTVFRLEAAAKELNQTLVVSGDMAGLLPDIVKFHDFGERELKGKSQLVRIYGTAD